MKQAFTALTLLAVVILTAALFKVVTLFKNLTFRIISFDPPTLNGGSILFPVNVEFNNTSPTSLTVDDIANDIYIQRGNAWVLMGTSNPRKQPIIITGHSKTYTKLCPQISVDQLIGELGSDLVTSILTFSLKSISHQVFRIDSKIFIAGHEVARDEKILNAPALSGTLKPIFGWLA